jgi:hypothetical protein
MLTLTYTLTGDECTKLARRFPWASCVPKPPCAHLECHGFSDDGLTVFYVTLHGGNERVKVRAVTAESALCQALAAWGVQHGDASAQAKADALRRRLAN